MTSRLALTPGRREDRFNRAALDALRPNPNPRLVWLIDYAIRHVIERLRSEQQREEFGPWLRWAATWLAGARSPATCVQVAQECFANKQQLVWHTLGQLAWGAKEACYSTRTSGWLVIRYIADAMDAFGVAFPETSLPLLLGLDGPADLARLPQDGSSPKTPDLADKEG